MKVKTSKFREDEFTSSNIKSSIFNSSANTVDIKFNKGEVYRYFNVSEDIYERFANADSQGKFFIANIKNEFDYKKI